MYSRIQRPKRPPMSEPRVPFATQPDAKEEPMKNFLFVFATAALFPAALMAQEKINPTDPQPTCAMCPGTLVPLAELEAYAKKAIAEKLVDQQVRDIDIGKARVGMGMVYRGKLDRPAPDSV